ncbi:MAG: VOC family protein, partial [Bacteroidota bacterium]
LTFVGEQCGKAEEAIFFYTSIFPNSEIKSIIKYNEGEPGGTPALVKIATFTLNGIKYMASENNYKHAWSFSPGVSIFVESPSDEEVKTLFDQLSSNGGMVMVPLVDYGSSEYGFGKKFEWCQDRYGISWQLNLME